MPNFNYINATTSFKAKGIVSIMFYSISLCLTLLHAQDKVISQDFRLGSAQVFNHTKDEYKAGSQIWDVNYNARHVFFANNGGLLYFNGIGWQITTTPNNTIMRSICIAEDDKVYIGAQDEFGYFKPGMDGDYIFHNLKDSLKEQWSNVSDIWDIEEINEDIYFSSDNYVHKLSHGQLTRFEKNSNISKMAAIGNEIWYHAINEGTFIIKENTERRLDDEGFLKGKKIVQFLSFGESQKVLLITEKNGLYLYDQNKIRPWKTNADSFLKNKLISSALYDEKYGLIIGTYLGGFLNINLKGQTILKLDKQSGLSNNNINSMSLTPNGILWLGTNNGISEIDLSNEIRKFYPDNDLEGAIYDMTAWKGNLYFSTSNGLYSIPEKDYYNPLQEIKFSLVNGTKGQTWGTDIIGEQLYCTHHEGPFIIDVDKNEAKKISEENGAWKFIQLDNEHVALGTYTGTSLYKFNENKHLVFKRKVNNFNESSRILLFDKFKNLWVSHPYKNVYKISFTDDFKNETLKVYTKKDGFEVDHRNYVYKINDHCYLTNETGIYAYNEESDSFTIAEDLKDEFETNNHVRTLIQDKDVIWAITNNYTCSLKIKANGLKNTFEKTVLNNLNTNAVYIGGFEKLFPIDDYTVFIPSESGMIEHKIDNQLDEFLKVSIEKISLPLLNDSLVYSKYFNQDRTITLNPNENDVKITFKNSYPNTSKAYVYSTKLNDLDNDWTEWTSSNIKEYTNLSYGEHIFQVKVKNHHGKESEIRKVSFQIKKPWYIGWFAYCLYAFILIATLSAIFLIPRRKYKETTALLEKEKLKKEEEIKIIKEEKLLDDIKYKNQQLASTTFQLLQRKQTLKTLRTKFDELNENANNAYIKKELNKILSIFRNDIRIEDDWDKFSLHFDQVHQDFIKNLTHKFPELTANDHKLCAYLKMNLSTKEIAPLLNISVRGVEIGRYRLRKKLNLDRNIKLNEFLNQDIF